MFRRRSVSLPPSVLRMHRAPPDRSSPVVGPDRDAQQLETQPTLSARERKHSSPKRGTQEVLSAVNRAKCEPSVCRKRAADKACLQSSSPRDTPRASAASAVLQRVDEIMVLGA